MESDTMELLRLMLAHLRPRLQGRDEEWQALERKQQELMASFRETHGGDVPLLEEVLEMEDAWAGAGERACAAHFFLGLQMGLDLGKLNYLREEEALPRSARERSARTTWPGRSLSVR